MERKEEEMVEQKRIQELREQQLAEQEIMDEMKRQFPELSSDNAESEGGSTLPPRPSPPFYQHKAYDDYHLTTSRSIFFRFLYERRANLFGRARRRAGGRTDAAMAVCAE